MNLASCRNSVGALLCVSAALTSLAGVAVAQTTKGPGAPGDRTRTLYRWVDEQGVTHFGDVVPPQYATSERRVLNAQGVEIDSVAGQSADAASAQAQARRAEEERAHAQAMHDRERDQHLLATYLSVEEIENLRDRRVEILEGQARVTEQYLDHLHNHEHSLLVQLQHFRPYAGAGSPVLPDRIAEDLVRTENDIRGQTRNLEGKRQEATAMKAQFDADIARFREMKRTAGDPAKATSG